MFRTCRREQRALRQSPSEQPGQLVGVLPGTGRGVPEIVQSAEGRTVAALVCQRE